MNRTKRRAICILRGIALLSGAACIWLGINRGESAIVLRKAARICLECIGVAG